MKKTKKRKLTKVGKITVIILIILLLAGISYGVYYFFAPKFKDITIELGTNKIEVKDFIKCNSFVKKAKFVTNINDIDLTKVGTTNVTLSFNNKKETIKLTIKDTTSPKVEFKDHYAYLNYELNPEDFVIKIEDFSNTNVTSTTKVDTSEFGETKVLINVTDESGNVTKKECTLYITWLANEITHEKGTKFNIKEIVLNEEYNKYVSTEEINKIDINTVGDYTVTATYEEKEYISTIHVKDTTSPKLVTENKEIFLGDKIELKDFVTKVEDASEYKLSMKETIDFNKLGTQNLTIVAEDEYKNVTTNNVTLSIKEDKEGPVFSGTNALTVAMNSTVNYKSGVKAIDNRDGNCEFNVDTSSVDIKKSGTYYAVYTSTDQLGNSTTAKRKIIVVDKNSTEYLLQQFYDDYCKGKSVLEITQVVRNKVYYSHDTGGSDPIRSALLNRTGDCQVHAKLVKALLDIKGVENQIIYVKDKTHYWNLVQENGIYRHYDSTPGTHIIGPATDTQKWNSKGLHGRQWDKSLFPEAK